LSTTALTGTGKLDGEIGTDNLSEPLLMTENRYSITFAGMTTVLLSDNYVVYVCKL
jgi:hypothetical protein